MVWSASLSAQNRTTTQNDTLRGAPTPPRAGRKEFLEQQKNRMAGALGVAPVVPVARAPGAGGTGAAPGMARGAAGGSYAGAAASAAYNAAAPAAAEPAAELKNRGPAFWKCPGCGAKLDPAKKESRAGVDQHLTTTVKTPPFS